MFLRAAFVGIWAAWPAAAEVLVCRHHLPREGLHPRCGVDEILRPGLAALGIPLAARTYQHAWIGLSPAGRPLAGERLVLYPEGVEPNRARAALEGAGPELAALAETYRERVGRYFCPADRPPSQEAKFVAAGGAVHIEVLLHLPYPPGGRELVTLAVETCDDRQKADPLAPEPQPEAIAGPQWPLGREFLAIRFSWGLVVPPGIYHGAPACCPSAELSLGREAGQPAQPVSR